MELATLPFGTTEHGPSGGAQAAVIIGDDIFHPAQAARLKALQKGAPVHLGLGQGHRDAEHTAALVRANAYRRKHVRRENDSLDRFLILLTFTYHAAHAHLFVTGIDEEIFDLTKGAGTPGLKFLVEKFHGATDPLTGSLSLAINERL